MAGRGKLMTKPAWLVQKERDEAAAAASGTTSAGDSGGGGSMAGSLYDQFETTRQPPLPPQPLPPALPPLYVDQQQQPPQQYQPRRHHRSPPPPTSQARRPPPHHQYDDPRPRPSMGGSNPDTIRARRLFVSGVQHLSEDELRRFFGDILSELTHGQVATRGVMRISVNNEKNFAFVEFAEPEYMHAVLDLQSRALQGITLRFQKPKDYELTRPLGPLLGSAPPPLPLPPLPLPMDAKISVDNVPRDMNEQQFSLIFATYGQLRSAQLFQGGRGMVEYTDPRAADFCYAQLPQSTACYGMRLSRGGGSGGPVAPPPLLPSPFATAPPPPVAAPVPAPQLVVPTSVLLLLNMVTREEVADEREYREILEDVETEAKRFGQVRQVLIPRDASSRAVGRVFIAYARAEDAVKAHAVMHNRKFSGRTVEARFYSERAFTARQLDV